MISLPSRNKFINLCFMILITMGLVATGRPAEMITLAFFRVVDKAAYARSPANYERVVYRDRAGDDVVYIERRPAHQIPANGIVAILVTKTKKFGNRPEEKNELERISKEIETTGRVTKRSPETYPSGFYYSITFKMNPSEYKRFSLFANRNLKGSFQMRLGKSDLWVLPYFLPYDESSKDEMEFGIATQEDDANRIKEMLSPIRDKVSWK
jgi:hypothetical protein